MNDTNRSTLNFCNISTNPTGSVLIAFHIGRLICIICIVFGIIGNVTLILTILHSSFRRFPYGFLLLFLSAFDILRLFSTSFYYLIQANIISLTLKTLTIYVASYRYPKLMTNWLKVFLAIERLLAVKYWIENSYNINSNIGKRINYIRQRKVLVLILLLLLCCFISQHPNFLSKRFTSTYIDPCRLLIINIPNRSFYYGNYVFNGILFTIISYIIIDDLLPIILLIICNTILVYQLKHLPKLTRKKLSESIFILFFLTIFSIFVVPRSFLVVFNLYVNRKYINNTIISIVFHTVQGLEMLNHAITGYACFLSSQTLRRSFRRNVRILIEKFQRKTPHSIIQLSSSF